MNIGLKLRARQSSHEPEALSRTCPTLTESWIVTGAVFWFMTGLFLDGWAHNHIPELETFFTPWHAVFYSGYIMIALALLCMTWRHSRIRGGSLLAAVPVGYEYALAGVLLFGAGGIGDLAWHWAFGIEKSIEALLSPTHLILLVAGVMMTGANLRAWTQSPPPLGIPSLEGQLPMLVSVASVLSLITFMLQFSHLIVLRAGLRNFGGDTAEIGQAIAITGYLLDTALMLGCVFFILRRARLAFGAVTFIFTLNILAMALMRDGIKILPSAVAAGMLADILARRLFPLEMHARAFRIFAFAVPASFFLCYFLTIQFTTGIAWSVHLWTGSIVMAGLAGLLLSFIALPPREG